MDNARQIKANPYDVRKERPCIEDNSGAILLLLSADAWLQFDSEGDCFDMSPKGELELILRN